MSQIREFSEESSAQGHQAGSRGMHKYLTFALGNEEYGLDILRVREIIGLMEITNVPKMPECVRGVINLRGKVIPVVDLRAKFGMTRAPDTQETCIIVADLGNALMGIVVDRVREVLDISTEDIEAPPSLGADIDTHFILGIGKTKDKVVLLLDVEKVLAFDSQSVVIPKLPATKEV